MDISTMTLYDFIALNDNDKAIATWDGVLLETRVEDDFKVLLYDLGGFYVEVFYNDRDNKIERFKSFKRTAFRTIS